MLIKFAKFQLNLFWRLIKKGYSPKTIKGFKELGWSLYHLRVNWGDLLVRETAEKFFHVDLFSKFYSGVVFGGSMLGPDLYETSRAFSSSKPILAVSCGIKEPLKPFKIPSTLKIIGVRGYKTAEIISKTNVVGDPGMLSPILFGLKPTIGSGLQKIFIPHASDNSKPIGSDYKTYTTSISYGKSSIHLLRIINESDFVLAGRLHAGICAYACGTPFSFYAGMNAENLFKYHDFASVQNFEVVFNNDFQSGIEWYLNHDTIRNPTKVDQFNVYARELEKFSRYTKSELYSIIRCFNDARNDINYLKTQKLKQFKSQNFQST